MTVRGRAPLLMASPTGDPGQPRLDLDHETAERTLVLQIDESLARSSTKPRLRSKPRGQPS